MTGSIEIHGVCDTEFEPVREAFRKGFDEGLEVGASVAVTRNGEPVVGVHRVAELTRARCP